MDNKIHIIAEAGTNHNGEVAKAKKLAEIAKNSGADSVKFQIINTWGLYLPGEYEYGHYKIEDVIKIRQKGEISKEGYKEVAQYCKEIGIPFSASVFDKDGLDMLHNLNPPYIKIASCDLNNVRFLRQVSDYGIKVVLSTGMSSLNDIEKGVAAVTSNGFNDLVLLHCVSVYPANLRQANLSFVPILKEKFGFEVGFSDHTGTSHAACMALSLGASWFEKHFTEDRNQEGLDHAYAMEEVGLSAYVDDLRNAFTAMQTKDEKIIEAEFYTRKRARRSLYAAQDLPIGHVVTDEDVLCVRPENKLGADQIDEIIGKKLIQKVDQYMPFVLDHFGQ